MTALTYAIVLLMAGMAASLPTTAVLGGTNVTVNGTIGVNTTVSATTTPIPSDSPTQESDASCGFMWGSNHKTDDDACKFYQVQDYGFVFFLGLWVLYFSGYAVALRTGRGIMIYNLEYVWTDVDWFVCVLLFLCTFFFEAVFVVLFAYYWYRALGSTPVDPKGADSKSSEPSSTPLVTGPDSNTPPTGMTSRFNQRFPKIAPGDCRPKYTKIQTSAC